MDQNPLDIYHASLARLGDLPGNVVPVKAKDTCSTKRGEIGSFYILVSNQIKGVALDYSNQPPYNPSQYPQYPQQPPPQKGRSKTWLWILLGVGIPLLLMSFCCCVPMLWIQPVSVDTDHHNTTRPELVEKLKNEYLDITFPPPLLPASTSTFGSIQDVFYESEHSRGALSNESVEPGETIEAAVNRLNNENTLTEKYSYLGDGEFLSSEIKMFNVRGVPTPFTMLRVKLDDDSVVQSAEGYVTGKTRAVRVYLRYDERELNEDDIRRTIESIR